MSRVLPEQPQSNIFGIFWPKKAQKRKFLSDTTYISDSNFETYGAVIHNIWFHRFCRYPAGGRNPLPII